MKIVVLDSANNCIEVWPVYEGDFKDYGGEDDFDATAYLINHRIDMDNIVYLCFEEDVPVYWQNETIPYTSL